MKLKTAVVTGSSSGIGYSITSFLLNANYKVYALYNSQLPNIKHPNIYPIKCNLLKKEQILNFTNSIKNKEAISVLVKPISIKNG